MLRNKKASRSVKKLAKLRELINKEDFNVKSQRLTKYFQWQTVTYWKAAGNTTSNFR